MIVEVRPLIEMNTHVILTPLDLRNAVIFEEFNFNGRFFYTLTKKYFKVTFGIINISIKRDWFQTDRAKIIKIKC